MDDLIGVQLTITGLCKLEGQEIMQISHMYSKDEVESFFDPTEFFEHIGKEIARQLGRAVIHARRANGEVH